MIGKNLGLFETMRAYKGNIVDFSGHIRRIRESCAEFNVNFADPPALIKRQINDAVRKSRLSDARVKLVIYKAVNKPDISVTVKRYKPVAPKKYKEGLRVDIARFRQKQGSTLALHKLTDRRLYESAFEDAKKSGFDEALILNKRGNICEASRSNIFFVKNGLLCTPDLRSSCLPGITRQVVLDLAKSGKIKAMAGKFTLEELLAADEAFLTNSLFGVIPLAAVREQSISKGDITEYFMNQYSRLLKNANKED